MAVANYVKNTKEPREIKVNNVHLINVNWGKS